MSARIAWLFVSLVGLAIVVVAAGCADTRRSRPRDAAGPPMDGAVSPFDAGPLPDAGPPRDAEIVVMDSGAGMDGQLRLVDGAGPSSGRLEVFHAGEWGTVCDDGFDMTDATVACRQLGYSSGTVIVPTPGVDPIWMDDLACAGSEARLADCPFSGWAVHNCSHGEDVGLSCS